MYFFVVDDDNFYGLFWVVIVCNVCES